MFTGRIDLLGAHPRLTPAVRARRLAIIFQEVANIFADEADEEEELGRRMREKRERERMDFEWEVYNNVEE